MSKKKTLDIETLNNDIFEVQNKVRQNPKWLISHLKKLRDKFEPPSKAFLLCPGNQKQTKEGIDAVIEAIDFCNNQVSVPAIERNKGIDYACWDHCDDCGPTGLLGHYGKDKSDPKDRMMRYGDAKIFGENLAYGDETGLDTVMWLVIDDGVPDRAHRINIFSADWTQTGVGSAYHKNFGCMYVIGYAKKFKANGTSRTEVKRLPESRIVALQRPPDAHAAGGTVEYVENAVSWKTQTTKIKKNGEITEIMKIIYKMKDGSTKVVTKKKTLSGTKENNKKEKNKKGKKKKGKKKKEKKKKGNSSSDMNSALGMLQGMGKLYE